MSDPKKQIVRIEPTALAEVQKVLESLMREKK